MVPVFLLIFPFYRSLDLIFNMNYYDHETSLPLVILFSKGLNSLPNIPQLMNKLSSTMRKNYRETWYHTLLTFICCSFLDTMT